MEYRKLGRTQLDVSAIGFGASALGNVFGDVSSAAADRTVAAAIDAGINLFDVSPYYGSTLAEARLGSALQGKRSAVWLGTKCGRYGMNDFDFSAATITTKFEQSLLRLRTDYVDLLQVHDVEFGDIDQIENETLPALRSLREQGKVRFIGVTSYWPHLLARIANEAELDCVLNYCHANLFADDMLEELVPVARAKHLGLMNASPLHMGLLSDRPVPAWHPAPQAVQQAAMKIRQVSRSFDVDPGTLALRACLDLKEVAATFVGLSSVEEVEAACAALTWSAPPELREAVDAIVRPVFNVVWPSGLEENAPLMGEQHAAL